MIHRYPSSTGRTSSSWLACGFLRLLVLLLRLHSMESLAAPTTSPLANTPIESGLEELQSSSLGFYVHIPYCRRRCRYCNFAIVPVGSQGLLEESTSFMDVIHKQYQADLFQEMDQIIQPQTQTTIPLTSIYFGGGTPSLAPVSMIEGILNRIRNKFQISETAEITMEMDPGTFDRTQLQALHDLGINRISLGVQSFDDTILEQLGRVHRKVDIDHAVELIHQVFGNRINYSMDLISGVPSLTEAKWVDTLQIATGTDYSPSHLSIYDLQVEEGTVFGTWYANGGNNIPQQQQQQQPGSVPRPLLPSEDSVARMYKFTAGYLRAKGFEHYEVSSYARCDKGGKGPRNPHRSRHNQIYWEPSGSWYAVGLGATSCINGRLQARPKTMADYRTWVQQMDSTNNEVRPDVPSDLDLLTDIIMKRLRTSDGLDLEWVQQRFGPELRKTIVKGAQLGLEMNMARMDKDSARLYLIDPEGFLYSNYIISSIFAELGYE